MQEMGFACYQLIRRGGGTPSVEKGKYLGQDKRAYHFKRQMIGKLSLHLNLNVKKMEKNVFK